MNYTLYAIMFVKFVCKYDEKLVVLILKITEVIKPYHMNVEFNITPR